MDKHLIEDIKRISLSLFNKDFFSVYHGSISARISLNGFIINSKDTMLDEVTEESLVRLDCLKRDYRWNIASSDVHIHEHLYKTMPNAKYILYTMPPYATAYSLKHSRVVPLDFYGKKVIGEIVVYDPKNLEDWLDRAPFEIPKFFQQNSGHLILVRGFGVISYDRDIKEMAKKISILENSCRLLSLSANL